jgi:hypothetical protein
MKTLRKQRVLALAIINFEKWDAKKQKWQRVFLRILAALNFHRINQLIMNQVIPDDLQCYTE